MFMLIYNKSTKHIVSSRNDMSTPAPQTADYWFSVYIKDNKIAAEDAQDLTFVETEHVDMMFNVNQYTWNESTQQIEADPSYVAPAPISPPVEPAE